jgi:hypothetical protein
MLLPRLLDAGSAGFYAGARHTVWHKAALVLSRAATSRALPCSLDARAALASTLARATLWRKTARVLPRVAVSRSLLCSLNAGNAGFYAGASLPVARVDAIAA